MWVHREEATNHDWTQDPGSCEQPRTMRPLWPSAASKSRVSQLVSPFHGHALALNDSWKLSLQLHPKEYSWALQKSNLLPHFWKLPCQAIFPQIHGNACSTVIPNPTCSAPIQPTFKLSKPPWTDTSNLSVHSGLWGFLRCKLTNWSQLVIDVFSIPGISFLQSWAWMARHCQQGYVAFLLQ